MDFTGQTAIVTGGANGIGRGCCLQLASLGANVVAADIDTENAMKTGG
ncbi:MAG: SDR family NAD(P)-dependent oxidoreductase [Eubacteriales bacterium]